MTDFFREVDEDVRRDRIIRLWTEHRYVFIAVAVLVVASTGAWRAYDYYRNQSAEAAGAAFEAAEQLASDGKFAESAAAFDRLSKTATKGYASLARLRAAGEIAAHDPQAAIKAYDVMADDPSFGPAFKDLAKLRAAMLRIDHDDPLDFEHRYGPVASANYPYRAQILELLGLAALKRQDFESAGRWLDGIVSDMRAPAGVRMRAGALLGLVQSSMPGIGKTAPVNAQSANPTAGDSPAK
jgi:hypothetical protein